MTREEFEKIKEAEKEHLRALRKLKQTVRDLEKRKSVNTALTDMASKTGSLLDEHTALVEKLSEETAMQEARFEVALESIDDSPELDAKQQALQDEADLAKLEVERQQSRARDLVRQVKLQMGTPGTEEEMKAGRPTEADSDRTIGRGPTGGGEAKPVDKESDDDEEQDDPIPEKTIGRMGRR